eukprot:TRINITY_DN471_c0_g1_i5.p1 TRINITY_DN471_c0_g1~~TRINITY_DN471_c0_g1_i5.p1  ORF type:complete len:568 (-),score=208.37 TRINITY_DN471_c0_g1_i5:75-1778(-)
MSRPEDLRRARAVSEPVRSPMLIGSKFKGLFGKKEDGNDSEKEKEKEKEKASEEDERKTKKKGLFDMFKKKDKSPPKHHSADEEFYVTRFDELPDEARDKAKKAHIDPEKLTPETFMWLISILSFLAKNQTYYIKKLESSSEKDNSLDETNGKESEKEKEKAKEKEKEKEKENEDKNQNEKEKEKENEKENDPKKEENKDENQPEKEKEKEEEGKEKGSPEKTKTGAEEEKQNDKPLNTIEKIKERRRRRRKKCDARFDIYHFKLPSLEQEISPHDPKKLFKMAQQSGEGGFAAVYVAKSLKPSTPLFPFPYKKVAIKKLPHASSRQKSSNLREISALKFCKHPNIVEYLGVFSPTPDLSELWLVEEYMEGGTLTQAAKLYKFNESQVAYVAKGMLEALNYLHANNIIHRDLKSSNVMLSVTAQVKLIDFGLCIDSSLGQYKRMAGSPYWMPPEMIQKKAYSFPIDIWSFAVCILELSNRNPPNSQNAISYMYQVATEGIPKPLENAHEWTSDFKNFISQCLRFEPSERATAAQLLQHPFLQNVCGPQKMREILTAIFLENALKTFS